MIANIIAAAVIAGLSVFAVTALVKKYRIAKQTGNPGCIGCCGCRGATHRAHCHSAQSEVK